MQKGCIGCLVVVAIFVVLGIIIAMFAGGSRGTDRAASRGGGYAVKATSNERVAGEKVGGFSEEDARLYHDGLQHIRNKHESLGSFTIGQVIDAERGRREHRATAGEQAKARAHAAAETRRVAEEKNFFRGTPDCLVIDRRTVHTGNDEYSWYITGKLVNRCAKNFSYVQIEFAFYDSSGNRESSGIVNINNLEAGETWAFKKTVYETTSANGKWGILGISGF